MVEISMRLDTAAAARYLREKHGIPIEEKTLRNRRAAGNKRGPTCRYFGVKPIYDVPELDRWALEDALQPESPVRRNMRLREAERTKSVGNAEVIAATDAARAEQASPVTRHLAPDTPKRHPALGGTSA